MMRKTQLIPLYILEVWWTKSSVDSFDIGLDVDGCCTYNGVEKLKKMMLKYMYNLIVYTRTSFGINFGLM